MRDFIRLLTGRIAFERRARLAAVELAYSNKSPEGYPPSHEALRIYYFLLVGEFPN